MANVKSEPKIRTYLEIPFALWQSIEQYCEVNATSRAQFLRDAAVEKLERGKTAPE